MCFLLVITNFAERKSSKRVWHSPPFYTHPQGYKMCLTVYANGDGDGEDTHVSVYTHLMKGAFDDNLKWPFQGRVVLQLCNQLEDKRHCGHTISFSETTDPKAISRVTGGEIAESGVVLLLLLPTMTLTSTQSTTVNTSSMTTLTFISLPWSRYQSPGSFQLNWPWQTLNNTR